MLYTIHTIDDALERARVFNPLQSKKALFLLARGVKTLEAQSKKYSLDQLRKLVDLWRSQNAANLGNDDDFLSFMASYNKVKRLLGSDIMPRLWEEVKAGPFPSAADPFDNPDQKRLVAFCHRLQAHWRTSPFPLSCRIVASLLGHPSHTTAASWLSGLCAAKVLVLVELGKRQKASTYRYMGDAPTP